MPRSSTLGRFLKISVGIVLGSLLTFIMLTWLALEAGGIAIVETESADGTARSTHVWFATPDEADILASGELWVEAGTPDNGWYVDIHEREALVLTTASEAEVSGRYLAQPIPGEASHRKIRALLRAKYGLRDWWIATVFDTSRSVAVRLSPIPPDSPPSPTTTGTSTPSTTPIGPESQAIEVIGRP